MMSLGHLMREMTQIFAGMGCVESKAVGNQRGKNSDSYAPSDGGSEGIKRNWRDESPMDCGPNDSALFSLQPRNNNNLLNSHSSSASHITSVPKNTNLHQPALRTTSGLSQLDDKSLFTIMRCFPFSTSPKLSGWKTTKSPSFPDILNATEDENSAEDSPRCVKSEIIVTSNNLLLEDINLDKSDRRGSEPNGPTTIAGWMAKVKKHSKDLKDSRAAKKHRRRNSLDGTKMNCVGILARQSLKNLAAPAVSLSWFRERLKSWCQLSGHEGTILPATDHTIWKKRLPNENNESIAYAAMMNESLCSVVPRFYREVEHEGEYFMEIEDLTAKFENPAIMDVKIGTRTFLESEVTNPVLRSDLYQKMISVDPTEPTEEEHKAMGVTKLRYMQFRERESSTATLGFRIEAMKLNSGGKGGVCSCEGLIKEFKKIKTRDQVTDLFCKFIGPNNNAVRNSFIERLKVIRQKVETSIFFQTHEVIGSSLLFLYDTDRAGVWLIDFAKTRAIDDGLVLNHRSRWQLGNHEDGYLVGLDNMIKVLEDTRLRELPNLNTTP